jgi:hypothetical protein
MTAQMNVRTSHRLVDAGRGLLALAGVGLMIVGVPLALASWVGSPLPAGVPTLTEVTTALRDTYIPDELLVKALALVCWLVWIELVASLLVEAVAYVRGRKAGRVPLAGGLQRGAARLVATVALLGAVFASKGMSQPAGLPGQPYPFAQPAVTVTIDEAPVPPSLSPDVPEAPAAGPTYEVQRRDTLWDIAERHLGDPFRWQEIFAINEGCPQADGGCLTDPDLIYAGWQLQLPAEAVGVAPPPAQAPPGEGPTDDPSSLVIEGGMVLIDDGAGPPAGGDAVLVSEETGGATHVFDGMVLLPAPDGQPVLAAPGEPGPGGDELAAPHGPAPGEPARTGHDE